jgi:hypothetical protein
MAEQIVVHSCRASRAGNTAQTKKRIPFYIIAKTQPMDQSCIDSGNCNAGDGRKKQCINIACGEPGFFQRLCDGVCCDFETNADEHIIAVTKVL